MMKLFHSTLIPLLMIATTTSNVYAGDRDCDVDINHPYCTGEEGAGGMCKES
jgi:hypothetical protein